MNHCCGLIVADQLAANTEYATSQVLVALVVSTSVPDTPAKVILAGSYGVCH